MVRHIFLVCLALSFIPFIALAEAPFVLPLTDAVDFPGYQVSADTGQLAGLDMPEDFAAALRPGAVLCVAFTADSGHIWVTFPDSPRGAVPVGGTEALCADGTALITFEQLAAVYGDDASVWGSRLLCVSTTPWSVSCIRVGQCPALSRVLAEGADPADFPWHRLRELLAEEGGAPELPLRAGDSGPGVRQLTARLATLGYLAETAEDFTGEVTLAVKDFQVNNGLPETGLVDLADWERLMDSACVAQRTVYKSKKGKVYHEISTCSGMKTAMPLTLSDAHRLSLRPCEHCH